jgi:hypothetical protein
MQQGESPQERQIRKLTCEFLQSVEKVVEEAGHTNDSANVLVSVDQLKHVIQGLKPFKYIIPRENAEMVQLESDLIAILKRVVVYSVSRIETKPYYGHFLVMLSLIRQLMEVEHVDIKEDKIPELEEVKK